MKLSVLDLVSVTEGGTVRDALDTAAAAARVAEECGYGRYWVAEHTAWMASPAPRLP